MTKHSGKVGDRHTHHRTLERRVGEIVPDIESRIRRLSIEELENLGEAVLDFTSASDWTAWLQGQNNLTDN